MKPNWTYDKDKEAFIIEHWVFKKNPLILRRTDMQKVSDDFYFYHDDFFIITIVFALTGTEVKIFIQENKERKVVKK
jgi:hypothetical protein